MFVYKPFKKYGTVDISILTDSNQYIEYNVEFRSKIITKWVGKRIRSLFEPYLIDFKTDIAVSPLLDEDHPLYVYFMFLRQQIGFRLSGVDISKAVSRIHYYFTRKAATKSKFNVVWKKVIACNQCPWITQQIEYQLQNKGPAAAHRIRITRLTMFYLVVKNHLYRIKAKSLKNSQSQSL